VRLLVVGGGPAGITAALQARELGADVTLLEAEQIGGTNLNHGPAPVRTLARAARLARDWSSWDRFGLEGPPPVPKLEAILANAARVARYAHDKKDVAGHLRHQGIDLDERLGPVQFTGSHTVRAGDGSSWRADRIVIAVGCRTAPLPVPGGELALTYQDIWTLKTALRAHDALRNAGKPARPWGRILRSPFFPGRPDVVRVRGLAYGGGPDRTLDVYHRRDRPAGAPVLLHFHGGRFHSGNKAREARPLIRYLTSRRGFVCVSADYRLQPHVALAGQVADVGEAIAWVRAHTAVFGADPGTLFLAGSSAGANLAIRAVCQGETGVAGLICRYGYYGGLEPRGDMPPMLVVHGEKDMLIPPVAARAFAQRVRAMPGSQVSYAELPGAHHDFDLYESIRSAAVNTAVEQFAARVSTVPGAARRAPS